jgi:crotonobetainyl-CoA:carnitine CoA-transferase CaiB-like acyl-CoA transferase
MSGPCAGLTVVDLSWSLAGAITTMLLADNGADVTMVEPAEGHPLRADPGFLVWARGKRSLRAGSEAGEAALARDLAAHADILIEGFGHGEAERRGFDPVELLERLPRLIICALPSFGDADPDAALPPDDALVAARSGIMSAQPGFRSGPVFVRPPLSSYGAALLATQALGAALFDRERTGRGCRFVVPLLHGALAMQASHLLDVEHGEVFPPPRRTPYDGRPLYRLYQCQDGRWVHLGVLTPRFWPGVALATGHPDWISDSRYQTMPNLATAEEREAFSEMLAAEIDQKPSAEWLRLFDAHDVPVAPAQTADEFLAEPQLRATGMLIEVDDPRAGTIRQTGPSIHFHRTPGAVRGPAPVLGEEVAGRAGAEIERWAEGRQSKAEPGGPGPPLAGVRIVDCSSFIAGPLGPAFLADLGADVIKVEAPEGDGLRNARGFLAWNRGKRDIGLDLKRQEAREVLYRLVERADVFLENMRPGVAERLGVDYETLRRCNPRLVYCSVTAYGSTGPLRDKPGFDPLMQARSGIERAQGGVQNPPNFLLVPVTDNTCAMLNAVGIALALYERERSGQGQKLETSLLQAACLLQCDSLVDYQGRPARPSNDPGQFGPSATCRLYHCADGWIMLAAQTAAMRQQLTRFAGLAGAGSSVSARVEDMRLAEALALRFAARPVDECCRSLLAEGLPVARVTEDYQQHFAADPRLTGAGLVLAYRHPVYGLVRQPAVLARLADAPASATRPAPLIGEHTREILSEAGYDRATIADLVQRGIAIEPESVRMKGE